MSITAAAVRFEYDTYLPAAVFEQITELRIHRPSVIKEEARRRKKRTALTRDGKLVLLAVDHAARGGTQIRQDRLAMGDRYELLARAGLILADPALAGVCASREILEELVLLNYFE